MQLRHVTFLDQQIAMPSDEITVCLAACDDALTRFGIPTGLRNG